MGIEQSRRDDLESICYVIIYFLKGSLPWKGLISKNKQDKFRLIKETKMLIATETLCKGFPGEFAKMLKYCKNIKFDEKPDYQYIKDLLKSAFEKEGYEYDLNFDWRMQSTNLQKKSVFRHLSDHRVLQLKIHENEVSGYFINNKNLDLLD